MKSSSRTKEQLETEIEELRRKVDRLQQEALERKQTGESLRLTQFMINRAADGIFWMGPDARFLFVNDEACRSLGYSKEELLTMTVHDIDPNFPEERWEEHWEDVKLKKSFTFESRHRAKDGSMFPVEITVNHLTFDDREYNCAFARNISARKSVEENLAKETYFSEMVINSLPGVFYLIDQEGSFHRWNRNAEIITGYTPDEILQMKSVDFFGEEDRPLILEKSREVFEKGESYVEADLLSNNGKKTRYYFTGHRLVINGGLYIAGMGLDISDLKKTHDALLLARQDWENIFQAIGHPAVILDENHFILAANRATLAATGKKLEDIVGEKCHRLFHETSTPPEGCPFEQMLRSGNFEIEPMEIKAFGGIYLVSCTPVLDKKGQLQKVIHIATDITVRKKAEEALAQEKLKLEHITSSVNCGMLLLDNMANIVYANRIFEEWFGELSHIIGKRCYEVFGLKHPEQECPCMQTILTGQSVRSDTFMMNTDGDVRCFYIITLPIKDSDDNIQQITAVVIDITERKLHEEELNKFKFISDNANDAHFLVDRESRIQYVNETACRMMGYSNDELLAMSIPDIDLVYSSRKFRELFAQIQEGVIPPIQTVNRRKDGTEFCSEITVTGYEKDGKPYMFAVLRDITERKTSEEALKKANTEIEQWNRELEKRVEEKSKELVRSEQQLFEAEKLSAMGQMAGGLAHELNSPLAGLLPMIEKFRDEAEHDSEAYEELSLMYKACVHMARIIKDFGVFSRNSKGTTTYLDLNDVIEDTLSFSAVKLKNKGIKITKKYVPTLSKVKGIKTELQQVVLNMITNARDATPVGGTFTILTCNSRDGNDVIMEFSDSGSGIKKEHQRKIFDPFFTTKRTGEGTGLGLSVSYGIIKKHKGQISVRSKAGKGTTFRISLPALKM